MDAQHTDAIVVGGGVIGCATAYHLAKQDLRVRLLEQFDVGNGWGSSHGPSRIIRLAYDSLDYVRLAQAAYALWHELAEETGERLIMPVGGLDFGAPDALALDGIRATYQAAGIPFETLDRDAIMRRFPQFNLPAGTVGYYQPAYSLLAADRCVAALAAQAQRHGAEIHAGEPAHEVAVVGNGVEVRTDRATYRADRLILCAGSWMRPLLAQLGLDLPLVVLKEQLAFFAAHEPEQFMPGRFPLFIHRYPGTTVLGSGFPSFGHQGVKLMVDRIGPQVAPDDSDRSIDATRLQRLHAYATELLPDLTGEIIEAVSCRYTMTPDEDFIIDRHPAHPQVVIGSPCSGHGFKFAPAIGQILADLATRGTTEHDIVRFRLDRPALALG
jgi:monomeric sarcosine oxidase